MMNKILSVLALFIVTTGFAQNLLTVATIPSEMKEKANSLLYEEIETVDVSRAQSKEYSVTQTWVVFNKKGHRDIGTYIPYDNDSKIEEAEIFVYDYLGREVDHFKKRDFKDVSAVDGISLYIDDRILYVDYIPKEYPYILTFNYKTVSKSTAFVNPWYPIKHYNSSTLHSKYVLKFDPANKPKLKKTKLDGYDISILEEPAAFVFEAKNIGASEREPYAPTFSTIMPNVKFSLDEFYLKGIKGYGANWKDFGKWMEAALLAGTDELPESTIAQVKMLTENEPTNLGKAKLIYQYVQDKVRYISVQIGVGGWKPMEAKEVDKLSYGDCKALTNYTKALLDAVGVSSYYTILYAGEKERDIDEDFTRIEGNHAILGIPIENDIVWLECTSQDAPFGFGGDFIDDRDVLIVTPEGGEIVHTKVFPFDKNRQESSIEVIIEEEGNMNAKFKSVSTGLQYDDKYRFESYSQRELKEIYLERWDYMNGLSIQDFNFENEKEEVVFTESISATVENCCSNAGENLLFCPNIFNRLEHVPPRSSNRKFDFIISEGFQDVDTVKVVLSENYVFENLPSPIQMETEFGSYKASFEAVDVQTFVYRRSFSLKKGNFPPDQYDAYRKFMKSVAKKDKTKIILKKKTN